MRFGHAADLDQRVEIDAGVDAHLLAEQHQFLGADIAGRALLTGEGAAAEPADGRVELRHAELAAPACALATASPRVSCRCSAIRMSGQRARTSPTPRSMRIGVAQPIVSASEKSVMLGAGLGGDRSPSASVLHDLRRRDVALVVAAEGGHHADAASPARRAEVQRGLLAHRLEVLGMAAVEVLAA